MHLRLWCFLQLFWLSSVLREAVADEDDPVEIQMHPVLVSITRSPHLDISFKTHEITAGPTNVKTVLIFSKTGFFLRVTKRGSVKTARKPKSPYTKFEIQSFGPSIIRFKNKMTNLYLAMNKKGRLITQKEGDHEETLFHEYMEENVFSSYASYKYRVDGKQLFVAVKRQGQLRRGTRTVPGLTSTQFLLLSTS